MIKVSTKVFFSSFSTGLIVALACVFGSLFTLNSIQKFSEQTTHDTMMKNYDSLIQAEVETIYSLAEQYHKLVLTGVLSEKDAKKQAADIIRDIRYTNNGYFWIDTAKGDNIVLLGGAAEGTNRFNAKDANGKLLIQDIIGAALNGGGFADYYFPKEGETEPLPKRSYSLYFEPFDWSIGTGNYVDDMQVQIHLKKQTLQKIITKGLLIMFLVILTGIALTAFVALIFGKKIAKPITQVSAFLKELSLGDADLMKRLPVLSHDEIGELSTNYNIFLEKLGAIVKAINNSMLKMIDLKETVSNGSEETLSALNEISANATSMNQRLQFLETNINDASNAVATIDTSIDSVDNGIESQVSAVEQATASVNQMVASLKNVSDVTDKKGKATRALADISNTGKQSMEDTRAVIQKINNHIGSINEMVSMINAIASQTNLLAMNAAIEAAHAGEAGQGFAVVASEIRKLAETSSKNAKDIGINLKQILSFINEADTSSEKSLQVIEQVNGEVKETAESLEEIFSNTRELFIGGEQILQAMTSLTEISLSVRENSMQMKTGSQIMSTTVSSVSDISREVVTGMNEVTIGTHEITKSMDAINKQMVVLSDLTDSFQNEVGKFKL